MVERILRYVLERHGLAPCLKGDKVRISSEVDGNVNVSISNDLQRMDENIASKIQKELLEEFLKQFNDVHILKDEETWVFKIKK